MATATEQQLKLNFPSVKLRSSTCSLKTFFPSGISNTMSSNEHLSLEAEFWVFPWGNRNSVVRFAPGAASVHRSEPADPGPGQVKGGGR